MLIDDIGHDIDDQRLDQIERQHAAEHEAQLVMDDGEDRIAHGNDRFQRDMIPVHIERNDERIIGKRTDESHA